MYFISNFSILSNFHSPPSSLAYSSSPNFFKKFSRRREYARGKRDTLCELMFLLSLLYPLCVLSSFSLQVYSNFILVFHYLRCLSRLLFHLFLYFFFCFSFLFTKIKFFFSTIISSPLIQFSGVPLIDGENKISSGSYNNA